MNINIVSPGEMEFLTKEELEELTRVKNYKAKKEWLIQKEWNFSETKAGISKVLR